MSRGLLRGLLLSDVYIMSEVHQVLQQGVPLGHGGGRGLHCRPPLPRHQPHPGRDGHLGLLRRVRHRLVLRPEPLPRGLALRRVQVPVHIPPLNGRLRVRDVDWRPQTVLILRKYFDWT